MVEIFEFSTGIKADRTADGKWFSRGFTGVYLNNTFPDQVIPEAIDRAIKNKLFDFPESCQPKTIAMVGRLIPGEVSWSVLAVATRGNDEPPNPRYFTTYRYYAVQDDGDGNGLFWILGWLEERLQRQQKLIFDPFDIPVSQEHIFDAMQAIRPNVDQFNSVLEQQPESYLVHKDVLLLKPSFQLPPFANKPKLFSECYLLCALAQNNYLQSERQFPLAWAYQVVRLAKPGNFSVIHVSDAEDIPLIQKLMDSAAVVPASADIDERAVKIAIKNLTGKVSVKNEDVQVLEALRLNPQVSAAVWESFFEAEGSSKATSQKIYSPQMFRLLPLEARFLPERLPRFLKWLAGAPDSSRETVLRFMQAYRNSAPDFDMLPGLKVVVAALLGGAIDEQLAVWLLGSGGSFWEGRDALVELLNQDFHAVLEATLNPMMELQPTFEIWQPLQRYLKSPAQLTKDYTPLINVLFALEKDSPTRPGSKANQLNAFLANAEQGFISSRIYVQGFPKQRNNYKGFTYNKLIPVRRKLSSHEAAFLLAQEVGDVFNGFFQITLVRWLVIFLAGSAVLALLLKVYSRFDVLPGASAIAQLPLMGRSTPEPTPSPTPDSTPSPVRLLLDMNLYPTVSYQDEEMSRTIETIRSIISLLNLSVEGGNSVVKFLSYLDINDMQNAVTLNISSDEQVIELLNSGSVSEQDKEQSIDIIQDGFTRRLLYQAIYGFQERNPQVRSDDLAIDRERFPNGRIVSDSAGTGRYIMCAIAIEEGFADQFGTPCPDDVGELR